MGVLVETGPEGHYKSILRKFGKICATGNEPRQLKAIVLQVLTDLCNRKYSYATGNNFMQDWTDLFNRICSYAAGNKFMQDWTDL